MEQEFVHKTFPFFCITVRGSAGSTDKMNIHNENGFTVLRINFCRFCVYIFHLYIYRIHVEKKSISNNVH